MKGLDRTLWALNIIKTELTIMEMLRKDPKQLPTPDMKNS